MVRVAIRATGICHSDLSAMQGTFPIPTPCVLGHEGVGEIVETGPDVTDLVVGDHVIATGVSPGAQSTFCLPARAHPPAGATSGERRSPTAAPPAFPPAPPAPSPPH